MNNVVFNIPTKVSFLDPTNIYTVSKYQAAAGSANILNQIFDIYL